MKRSLAYITAAWRGDPGVDMEQAAHYCRVVYDAGYSPICPMLYLPLFLNDAVPEEHKNGIDMARDLLRRSRVLVVEHQHCMLFFIEIFKEFIKLVPMSFIMIYITSHLSLSGYRLFID